jgi:iron complex outermembrane receptor protein
MPTFRLMLVFTFSLVTASLAAAEALTGRVADPQGGVVVGATVRLSGTPLPGPRTTSTEADGTFAFEQVAPGRYTLRVEAVGFVSWSREVTVVAGDLQVPVALQIAGFSENVSVSGEAVSSSLTKTNIPLKDQPMNVSTVSSQFLRTFAVNDLVTALANVPGVSTYQQYGVYEHYTIRGFAEGAQMVDGIRNEGNRVRTVLSNVERIEVLKGPSAVLSGNEAIGSSVNIVLKKPSAQRLYEGTLTYGSWNTTRASGAASGRLGDSPLLYRLDVGTDVADNFRHDPWNKINITPSLSWQMGVNDRVEFRYSFSRNDVSGDSGIPLMQPTAGVFVIPDVPRDRRYNTPQDFALSTDQNIQLTYTRQLGNNFGFRNVYAPRVYDDEYWIAETFAMPVASTDVNRTFLYFKHKRRPWTNLAEFTGTFNLGLRHNFLAGLDHQSYNSRTTRSNAANITTTRINVFNPVETHTTHTDFTISRYDHSQNYTNGVYLQDHVEIGPKVKAVVLGRMDYVDRTTFNNPVVNNIEGAGTVTKSIQKRWSSRYGVVYQPIDRLDVYAQYATSFKPNFNLQPDGTELKPEIGAQWEIGNRVRLFGNRTFVNTSIYHIERQNVTNSRPGGFFDQAGMVRSQGLEVELDTRWSSMYVTLGYGYTDAKFLDYVTVNAAGVPTVLSGNTKSRTPTNTFSYQVGRMWQSGISVAVAGRSHGRQFLDDANTLDFDSYSLLDLAASYTRGRASYSLNFSNLTDTFYWASIRGQRQFYPGEPLRVMGTVRLLVN